MRPAASSADLFAAGQNRDGLYEPVLADSEREAVADLLQYLENVSHCFLRAKITMTNDA